MRRVRVPVTVDTHVRVHESFLTPLIVDEIKEALSIPNKAKLNARKEKLPDWRDLPDSIIMWDYDEKDRLKLPRGFQKKLSEGLGKAGYEIDWRDETSSIEMDEEFYSELTPITLRPHQVPAVNAILESKNGIYKAPPAAGKTVSILEAIRRSGQRSIILVDKSELQEQWVRRIKEFLGVDAGRIGEGEFDPGEITVALKQTLWRRKDELLYFGFFHEWGFVAYDEVHHVTAETYQFVVQQFCPKYLIGASATPVKIPWTFPIARNLIGPIIHTTTSEELQDSGYLMKPRIRVIETDFNFNFRPTYINDGGYRVGSNYQKLIKEIITNKNRNQLIVDSILERPDKRILVTSARHQHFDELEKLLIEYKYPRSIMRLTGKENRDERLYVIECIRSSPGVIFSTVADEGLDIPTLDTLIIAFPTRNIRTIRQKIGRVEREAPDKQQPEVLDIYDPLVGPLKNQFRERLYGIYKTEKMDIEYV